MITISNSDADSALRILKYFISIRSDPGNVKFRDAQRKAKQLTISINKKKNERIHQHRQAIHTDQHQQ